MKPTKSLTVTNKECQCSNQIVDRAISSPEIHQHKQSVGLRCSRPLRKETKNPEHLIADPVDDQSGSDFQIKRHKHREDASQKSMSNGDTESGLERKTFSNVKEKVKKYRDGYKGDYRQDPEDIDVGKRISQIQYDARKSARIIRDSKARLIEMQKKQNVTDADLNELAERSELLLREMDRFEKLTKNVQKLLEIESTAVAAGAKKPKEEKRPSTREQSGSSPSVSIGHAVYPMMETTKQEWPVLTEDRGRSKSEIDLTRKLSESYVMQEKLVADNADLEVKRYVLYKELMTKDQNLETCRAQIKRLQGEMKMMTKEHSLILAKLSKSDLEDPSIENSTSPKTKATDNQGIEILYKKINEKENIINNLEKYKNSAVDLKKDLGQLEFEVRHLQMDMDIVKKATQSACRGAGGPNSCFEQPSGAPPVPPMTRACGVCPPCPAPCNPNAPPTPAEREVVKLTIQLKQTEEDFKTKVTECAMLRAELVRKKEELEKERCQHREALSKLRDLEMRFEGLSTQTNMLLGTKEQALEQEVNVKTLKQCYRQAREEIDELRLLLKEQNDQLQDYRSKYIQAQQMVEEQRKQMDLMDMDNTRISEQINLEIQRVKLKFQEKLQELAPIPDLLKATQMRLKDAQQSQAIAEHNAEQLARELNCAREKVHVLLHNSLKPPEKPEPKGNEEKQMQLLNQRITQLSENNLAQKIEIERLKSSCIKMEEAVLANEKRLQEKMHECATLGGELDRARDEGARALQRANERTETVRKCLQTTCAELERQLAASRAQVKTAQKDREEIQCRMQCQIGRLNDNFEQAQLRILGLQDQLMTLRKSVSSTFDGDGDNEMECACKSAFDNP